MIKQKLKIVYNDKRSGGSLTMKKYDLSIEEAKRSWAITKYFPAFIVGAIWGALSLKFILTPPLLLLSGVALGVTVHMWFTGANICWNNYVAERCNYLYKKEKEGDEKDDNNMQD